MSRYVDLDEIVDAMYYDEEHEEWHLKKETIESALGHVDSYTVCKWIPVSERLPEVGQYVLVSTDMNYVATATFKGDYWESNFDLDREEVLAWQALPKPYYSMGENYGFPSKEEADLWMNSKPVGKEEI